MNTPCAACGSPVTGTRFCTTCGTPVAESKPAESPPPPPPPPPHPPPFGVLAPPATRPRRRAGRVLAAGLAALAVVVAAAAGYTLLGITGPWGAIPGVATPASTVDSSAPSTTRLPSVSSSPSAGAGTTPYVPVPTNAAADCIAPPSADAAGTTQTYEPAKAVDGRKDTAWRCPGDATGRTLTIGFGGPVQLTSVGLIPGYDKIDPTDSADRFVQGRTVTRVRWTFDDGSTVQATPNGERSMRTTPVAVRITTVRMTILETRPGTPVTNTAGVILDAVDTTAVSEVAFSGLR